MCNSGLSQKALASRPRDSRGPLGSGGFHVSRSMSVLVLALAILFGSSATARAVAVQAPDSVWAPPTTAQVGQATQGPSSGPTSTQAAAILTIARDAMTKYDAKAVILRVTIDDQEVVTEAMGESMTGVPATTDMHFRNGAVAISYVSTRAPRVG